MENLNRKTFFAYAVRMYNNPSCSGPEEFTEDLLRFKYIKRLLHKYTRSGDISPRLLLNHLIGVCNVFHGEAIARMLFFKVDEDSWPALKTALLFINLQPDIVSGIDGKIIYSDDIPTDPILLEKLSKTVENKDPK